MPEFRVAPWCSNDALRRVVGAAGSELDPRASEWFIASLVEDDTSIRKELLHNPPGKRMQAHASGLARAVRGASAHDPDEYVAERMRRVGGPHQRDPGVGCVAEGPRDDILP